MNQEGWSFDFAPQDKENDHVRNYILEACRNHDAELNGIYDEDGKSKHTMTEERKSTTNSRITSAFYSQKRQHVKLLTLSSDEIAHQRAITNRDARLREKYSKRMAAFNLNKADFIERYGADCEVFMDKGYMSDEEVAEVNNKGQTLSFTKLVPKWRSDLLEEFYRYLDHSTSLKSVAGNAPLSRVPKYTDPILSLEELDELPSWGVRDEYLFS
ncbi:hypothetical protein BD770DRAFT_416954 [Pilaira anomala]|nr:hypothetical protein BD770DRAFT_416954 [Pilaira anomala]